GVTGPFTWNAFVETATNVLSHNVQESFEGYERGARYDVQTHVYLTNVNFLAPWQSFTYPPNVTIWLNEGVQLTGSDGSQSAFMVATNPGPRLAPVATFGISYQFPTNWALPSDTRQWSNYVFSYDFMENSGQLCSVEMQVKNPDPLGLGKWLQYTNIY